MAKSNEFGVGLMHELAITASKAGLDVEDISSLSKNPELLKKVKLLIKGTHAVKSMKHEINCSAVPWNDQKEDFPQKIHTHNKMGVMKIDFSKVILAQVSDIAPGVKNGFEFIQILNNLKTVKTLNANVLDFLLRYPHLIPSKWGLNYTNAKVGFFGTIYRAVGYNGYGRRDKNKEYEDEFYVRCLRKSSRATETSALHLYKEEFDDSNSLSDLGLRNCYVALLKV